MLENVDEPYQADYIVHDISVSPRQNDFENIDWNKHGIEDMIIDLFMLLPLILTFVTLHYLFNFLHYREKCHLCHINLRHVKMLQICDIYCNNLCHKTKTVTATIKLHCKKMTIYNRLEMHCNIFGPKGMLDKCCKVLQNYSIFCVQFKSVVYLEYFTTFFATCSNEYHK